MRCSTSLHLILLSIVLASAADVSAMGKRPPLKASSTTSVKLPEPGNVGVGVPPPTGAIVLFGGTDGAAAARAELHEKWVDWRDWPNGHAGDAWKSSTRNTSPPGFEVVRDPAFPNDTNHVVLQARRTSSPLGRWGYDDIEARPEMYRHEDARIHVEWMTQDAAANSGVYIQGRYEIQILSATKPQGKHGVAALVDEHAPSINAGRPDGVWQSYDVVFRAARWKKGKMTEPARMSVWWNGVLVHDRREVQGIATGLRNTSGEPIDSSLQPLKLQFESGRILYRNIWYVPLEN